jgi:hypothetical protein
MNVGKKNDKWFLKGSDDAAYPLRLALSKGPNRVDVLILT